MYINSQDVKAKNQKYTICNKLLKVTKKTRKESPIAEE